MSRFMAVGWRFLVNVGYLWQVLPTVAHHFTSAPLARIGEKLSKYRQTDLHS